MQLQADQIEKESHEQFEPSESSESSESSKEGASKSIFFMMIPIFSTSAGNHLCFLLLINMVSQEWGNAGNV